MSSSPANGLFPVSASLTKSSTATQTLLADLKPQVQNKTNMIADGVQQRTVLNRKDSLKQLNNLLKSRVVVNNKTVPVSGSKEVKGFKSRLGTIDNLVLARKPDKRPRHGFLTRSNTFVQSSPVPPIGEH